MPESYVVDIFLQIRETASARKFQTVCMYTL